MKTTINLSALIITLSILFSFNIYASNDNFTFEEENFIDDIPFNTESVAIDILASQIDFEDEAYIDDIPVNTASVSENYRYQTAINSAFYFSDEEPIDDIPFETSTVAENQVNNSLGMVVYEFN